MTSGTATGRARTDTTRIDASLVFWVFLAVAGLAGFAALTVALLDHVVFPFDATILAAARSTAGDGTFWRIMSESANIPLIVIGLGLVVILWVTHHRREAVVVALLLIAITAGSEGVKQLVARPRPEGTDPNIPGVVYSYPSGHVLEALSIFGILVIRVVRSSVSRFVAVVAVIALLVEVGLVGWARMALNAHYPTDVLAGWLGGGGMLGCYALLTRDRKGDPAEQGR